MPSLSVPTTAFSAPSAASGSSGKPGQRSTAEHVGRHQRGAQGQRAPPRAAKVATECAVARYAPGR
jgi:hypothetical protein